MNAVPVIQEEIQEEERTQMRRELRQGRGTSAGSGDTILEVEDLHKAYGSVIALDGIDLSVERGRIVGILGPNGAGKTTLVSIICGLRRADRGRVTVNGIDVSRHPQRARAHIGLAPQDMGIYPSVTVRNNLHLFADLQGVSGRRVSAQIERIATALRLEGLLDRKSGELSGGQKRRLHTAIALLNDPPLVMLDEPTTGADVETRAALLEVVTDLARHGSSVLYSTHYLPEIETLDATVVIIERGSLIASGTVEDLVAA
ncbi:MAG: ABC transporter ATP-binding protein, partial [Actinomycetota bacterium]